jgi:ATP-dependent Clp protease adaptor protein ClpS
MTKEIYKEKKDTERDQQEIIEHELILINDDIHSFDYVIDALLDVCNHSVEQAVQCTMITHYKGKCDVMKGEINKLRPARRALVEKELKAIIN